MYHPTFSYLSKLSEAFFLSWPFSIPSSVISPSPCLLLTIWTPEHGIQDPVTSLHTPFWPSHHIYPSILTHREWHHDETFTTLPLPPFPPSPEHVRVGTPIFITPGLQGPQATLFCSNPFHFQRPAQALLPLWSLLFLQTQMTSPSIALSANHFYSLSPSSSVLFFHLSYLSHSPTCTCPACWVPSSSSPFSLVPYVWWVHNKICRTTVGLFFFLLIFYCWHVLPTLNCKCCEGWNWPWLSYLHPLPSVPTDGVCWARPWVLH